MGEVNFLSKKEEEKKDDSSVPEPSSFSDAEKKVDKVKDKERIEKSRKEVLEMIDKNKDKGEKDKKANTSEAKKKSWFSGLFGGDKEEKPEPNNSAKQGDKKEVHNITNEDEKIIENKSSVDDENNTEPATKASDSIEEAKELESQIDKIKKGHSFGGKSTDKYKSPKKDSPFKFSNKSWKSSDVLETNLIDKSEYGFFDAQKKFKYFTNSLLATILAILVMYLGVMYWEHLELKRLEAKKTEVSKGMNEVKELEGKMDPANIFQEKLNTSKFLLDKHVYWTNFFDFLEEVTLAKVFYEGGFQGAVDGTYSLNLKAPSFEAVKNQLSVLSKDERVLALDASSPKGYENSLGQEIVLDGTGTTTNTLIEEGVESNVDFTVDESLFYKNYHKSDEDE